MDLKKLLKGAALVAGTVNPGVGLAIKAINTFLPADEQLPETATGETALSKLEGLPSDQQAAVLTQYIELQKIQEQGWTSRYEAMCKADGQETRAKIVYMMALILLFETIAFTTWFFVYPDKVNGDMWAIFGALTAVPAAVLRSYFGELRTEQANRLGIQQPNPSPLKFW